MSQTFFNDTTPQWGDDWSKPDHRLADLKNRTDILQANLNLVDNVSVANNSDIHRIVGGQEHMALVLGALTLSQMDLISKEELRRLYTMMISPDKENYLVAQELIKAKLNDFKEGKI